METLIPRTIFKFLIPHWLMGSMELVSKLWEEKNPSSFLCWEFEWTMLLTIQGRPQAVAGQKNFLGKQCTTQHPRAWHTLWLDQCNIIADANAALQSVEILHGTTMANHVPFAMTFEVESFPEVTHEMSGGCRAQNSQKNTFHHINWCSFK